MGDRVWNNFLVCLATTYDRDRGSLTLYFLWWLMPNHLLKMPSRAVLCVAVLLLFLLLLYLYCLHQSQRTWLKLRVNAALTSLFQIHGEYPYFTVNHSTLCRHWKSCCLIRFLVVLTNAIVMFDMLMSWSSKYSCSCSWNIKFCSSNSTSGSCNFPYNRSDEGLTLETSAFLPFTVANLRFQLSC